MPAAATTTATAAATASSATFPLRAGFIDDKRAAHELLSVESSNDFLGFRIVTNLGEAETARLTRETISKQSERIRLHTNFRK